MSQRAFNSQIDSLEDRRLLAFAAFNPSTGHINVTGTSGNDTIIVALSTHGTQVDVALNGTTESFTKTGVREMFIEANDGNDTVSIESALKSVVRGGDGTDIADTDPSLDIVSSIEL